VEGNQEMCVTYCECLFFGKVDRKFRFVWLAQEMLSETDDREVEERPKLKKEGRTTAD